MCQFANMQIHNTNNSFLNKFIHSQFLHICIFTYLHINYDAAK